MLLKELKEKLKFYKQRYEKISLLYENAFKDVSSKENYLKDLIYNSNRNFIGEKLDDEEIKLFFSYGVDIMGIEQEVLNMGRDYKNKIKDIQKEEWYKQVLKMIIHEEFKIIEELEKDETFRFLIDENFHNPDLFDKGNKFWILGYPKLNKYKKYSNKVAKRNNFKSFEELINVWKSFRYSFENIIGDSKIIEIKNKYKAVNNKIVKLQALVERLPEIKKKKVIQELTDFIFNSNEDTFEHFTEEIIAQVSTLKKEIKSLIESMKEFSNNMTIIMGNITMIDDMILNFNVIKNNKELNNKIVVALNNLNYDSDNLDAYFPKEEWEEIKNIFKKEKLDFEKKNNTKIKVENTHVTDNKSKIDIIMKKYGVKEGEPFELSEEDFKFLYG